MVPDRSNGEQLMKKLILLLLLIPSLAWGQASLSGVSLSGCSTGGGAGATAYCTAQTTCTATTPGQCDVLCEDLAGATECLAGEASTCRGAWAAVVETGGTVVFNASHSGTLACTDKGSYAIQVDKTGNAAVNARFNYTAKDTVYAQFYMNVVAEGLSDGQNDYLAQIVTDSGSNRLAVIIGQTAGQVYLKASYYTGSGGVHGSAYNISTGTWYRIQLRYTKSTDSNGVIEFHVDGNEVTNVTDNGATDQVTRFYVGAYNSGGAVTYTTQYDNIAVDDDTGQGACNL